MQGADFSLILTCFVIQVQTLQVGISSTLLRVISQYIFVNFTAGLLCFFFFSFINVATSACLCVEVLSYEVKTAASVPTGMLCSGRWRSELMLKPAMTPARTNKHTYTQTVFTLYIYIQCKAILQRKCKCDFDAENSCRLKRVDIGANLTCSSREEDPKDSKEVFSCTVIWHCVTAEQP